MKKTGCKKSRQTVPLTGQSHKIYDRRFLHQTDSPMVLLEVSHKYILELEIGVIGSWENIGNIYILYKFSTWNGYHCEIILLIILFSNGCPFKGNGNGKKFKRKKSQSGSTYSMVFASPESRDYPDVCITGEFLYFPLCTLKSLVTLSH